MRDDVPSLTAFAVLRGLDAVSNSSFHSAWNHLVPAAATPYIKDFLKEGARASWAHRAIAALPAPAAFVLAEKQIKSGIPLHYAARKLAIEHLVRDGIANGATQVVMISGGFDTLLLRLQESFTHITFFETDHPATQGAKLRALGRRGGDEARPNLHFLEADLSKRRLEDVLEDHPAYDRDRTTICVAEGITMYLDAQQVDQMFGSLRKIGGTGSQTVLGVLASNERALSSYKGKVAGKIQGNSGEDYKFALQRAELPEFARARGFRLDAFSSYQDLQDRVGGRRVEQDAALPGESYCLLTKVDQESVAQDIDRIPRIDFAVPPKA